MQPFNQKKGTRQPTNVPACITRNGTALEAVQEVVFGGIKGIRFFCLISLVFIMLIHCKSPSA